MEPANTPFPSIGIFSLTGRHLPKENHRIVGSEQSIE